MIKIFDDLCEEFIIEVPDGYAIWRIHDQVSVLDQTVCPHEWAGKKFPILHGPRGTGKGNLVGGHYQVFNKDSLSWICNNVLKEGRTYYVGRSIASPLGITLTTVKEFVSLGERLSQDVLVIEK